MPLACLIEGKILAVHGGIGNGKWTIDELAAAIWSEIFSDILYKTNLYITDILVSISLREL